jgi:hypothetical protein
MLAARGGHALGLPLVGEQLLLSFPRRRPVPGHDVPATSPAM